jgi:predicted Fe-Mo cluster-binding NifX family protein
MEEIPNPGHQPGFLPRFLAQKGVAVIVAGGMGPRAQALFAQNNIQTITGVQGEVKPVLNQLIAGQLTAGEDLCDHPQGPSMEDHKSSTAPMVLDGMICITAQGPTLQDKLDPRFGRASFFLFINPDKDLVEAVENPNKDAAHGAGIQSAQLVVNKKPAILITGQVGPKAQQVLDQTGIRLYLQEEGTVEEVLSQFDSPKNKRPVS